MSKLAVLNGNTIIIPFPTMSDLIEFVRLSGITQFAVNDLDLSTPVTSTLEDRIPGIIHGARARANDSDKPKPRPPTGGGSPDGTPPSGGTPGGTSVHQQTFTEARAA